MNTKKADWAGKPAFRNITLHSYEWMNMGKSIAFFTIGENENCILKYKCDETVKPSFMLFHTPSDVIVFSREEISIRLFGAELSLAMTAGNEIELRKSGARLSFYSEGKELLSTENPVFIPSATLAFSAEGEGNIYLEVF